MHSMKKSKFKYLQNKETKCWEIWRVRSGGVPYAIFRTREEARAAIRHLREQDDLRPEVQDQAQAPAG